MIIKSFKLGKYKGLNFNKPNIYVNENEINDALKKIQTSYEELIDKDKCIEKGDHIYFKYEVKYEDENIPNQIISNYHLKIGQGFHIEEFEKNFYGLKKSDKKIFDIIFPNDYSVEHLRGKKGVYNVEILNIKEVTYPKLNEQFVKNLEIDDINTIESLKEYIKKDIYNRKIYSENIDLINSIMRIILDNVEIEYYDEAVEEAVNEMINDINKQIKDENLSMNKYYEYHKIKGEDDLREKFSEEVKTTYLELRTLEEIAKVENIKLSDYEYNNAKKAYLTKRGIEEEDIRDENDFKKSVLLKEVINHIVEFNTI